MNIYTPAEDQIIREFYGKMYVRQFSHLLPRHSIKSIRLHAMRIGVTCSPQELTTLKSHRRYPLNERFFSTWSREMAYTLGWFLTDGNIYISPDGKRAASLQLKDREPLEIVRTLISPETPISECHRKKPDGLLHTYYRLRFHSPCLIDDLIRLGVTPRKSLTVVMPDVPPEYFWHFFRGVMDGDGTVGLLRTRKRLRLNIAVVSGSKQFLESLSNSTGDPARANNAGSQGQHVFGVCWYNARAYRLLKQVYQDSDGLRLSRKYDVFTRFLASGTVYSS